MPHVSLRALIASAAFVVSLVASRPAHAGHPVSWVLEGFVETGMIPLKPPDGDTTAPVIDVALGTTGFFARPPWFQLGVGARFSTAGQHLRWGRYYSLSIPAVVRFAIPLSGEGHQLLLSGGYGGGIVWQQIEPFQEHESATTDSGTTSDWEALVGYVGPKHESGLSFLVEGGTRWQSSDNQSMDLFRLVVLRIGVIWH